MVVWLFLTRFLCPRAGRRMPRSWYIFWFCDFDALECLMFPSFFLFPIPAQSPMDASTPPQAKPWPSPPDVMPPWDSPVCSNKHSHYFFLISQLPTLIHQGFRAPLKISSLGGTSTLVSEYCLFHQSSYLPSSLFWVFSAGLGCFSN